MPPSVPPSTIAGAATAGGTRSAAADWSAQVRGSTLLLSGRVLALVAAFALQILVVRSLSRADYGAFAYALAVVTAAESVALLGLYRGAERFVPLYEELGDRVRATGVIVVVGSACLAAGAVVVSGTWVLTASLGTRLVDDPLAVSLIQVVIPLALMQALERILDSLFAVYARPRRIFLRRYVLVPALRLAVVAGLVAQRAGAVELAAGYVTAGLVGVIVAVFMLRATAREHGLVLDWRVVHNAGLPWREVLRFSLPLFVSDMAWTLLLTVDTLLLGALRGSTDVAGLRAVYPVALLNQLVLASFTVLFTPAATRWFARGDLQGLARLHRRAGAWVALASFPCFAVTVVLSGPVVGLLFGARYEDAAPALSILAVGFYAHAAFGINGLTLAVLGQVRTILAIDVATLAASIVTNAVLIPPLGLVGAAIASAVSLTLHAAAKEVAVRRLLPDRPRQTGGIRWRMAAAGAVLIAVAVASVPEVVAVAAAVATTVWVVRTCAPQLDLVECFPELRHFRNRIRGRDQGGP